MTTKRSREGPDLIHTTCLFLPPFLVLPLFQRLRSPARVFCAWAVRQIDLMSGGPCSKNWVTLKPYLPGPKLPISQLARRSLCPPPCNPMLLLILLRPNINTKNFQLGHTDEYHYYRIHEPTEVKLIKFQLYAMALHRR